MCGASRSFLLFILDSFIREPSIINIVFFFSYSNKINKKVRFFNKGDRKES